MAKVEQLTKADLQKMYAAGQYKEIEEARKDGKFNDLIGAPVPTELPEPGTQWRKSDLDAAYAESRGQEIADAIARGDLTNVANGIYDSATEE